MALTGCASGSADAAGPAVPAGPAAGTPAAGPSSASATPSPSQDPATAPPAREGKPAASERIRFIPERVTLPGSAHAPVEPVSTAANGELTIPQDVDHVGWWDGSAWVNDAFGNTVIAGHVDSQQGYGFFARLLLLKVGEKVTVSSGSHQLTYKITSVRSVKRQALATDGDAFEQTGDHRLVLITCTGAYNRDRGGYDRNLVVTATPVGQVH